jgi:predicted transcriptional regulator
MIPIENHKNLYRDEKTGAIVNMDNYEYLQYAKIKEEKKKQKEEITTIKKDLEEIKSLLGELLNETGRNKN